MRTALKFRLGYYLAIAQFGIVTKQVRSGWETPVRYLKQPSSSKLSNRTPAKIGSMAQERAEKWDEENLNLFICSAVLIRFC